ncbi:MAG: hypothetical protein AB1442_11105, partial [Nitrospirota bacterium]
MKTSDRMQKLLRDHFTPDRHHSRRLNMSVVQNHKENIFLLIVLISAAFILMPFCRDAYAASAKQQRFRSPEGAVKSFIEALRVHDTKALLNIFGPE